MDLKTFIVEHLNELEAEGAWRLGGVCWVGDRVLRVTVALQAFQSVETPKASAVFLECHDVADAFLRLACHPHDHGELWITDEHALLDEFGPWARIVSEQPVRQPERLFAVISSLVEDHYGDISRASELATGLDWRREGVPHGGEVVCGPEPLVRQLLPFVRKHCRGKVELQRQPEATDLVRPAVLVGFSDNWIACDRATVVQVNGELGSMLGLEGNIVTIQNNGQMH
jgi:hypothetical protein